MSGVASLSKSSFFGMALAFTLLVNCAVPAQAKHKHATSHSAKASTKASGHVAGSHSSSSSSRHGHSTHTAAASNGRHHGAVAHHGRHHVVAHQAPKTRYAYPLGLFMKSPPPFDTSPLSADNAAAVARAFERGTADSYPARILVRAGIVHYHPLHGGIFWRREPVKYIVMHSTETGNPISAVRVIESWTSMGMRHPGAQYVVERDGTIYQAVDPDLATVHVNIFKTLPGINNDNSIGIEMNHTGSQDYPPVMREAVIKLVGYLKHRYNIDEGNIITHRYAQQGDHTDPVHFDWDGFLAEVNSFHNQAIAYRSTRLNGDSQRWQHEPEPKINTYLKPHKELGKNSRPDITAPGAQPPITGVEDTTDIKAPAGESTISPAPSLTPSLTPAPVPGGNFSDTVAPHKPTPESPVPEPTEADPTSGAPVKMKVYAAPDPEQNPNKESTRESKKKDSSGDTTKPYSDPNFEPMPEP